MPCGKALPTWIKSHKFFMGRKLGCVLILGCLVVAMTACRPVSGFERTSTPEPSRPVQLTPFFTSTPTLTPPLLEPSVSAVLPSITPTPRIHIIKQGQDLSWVAWYYGVSLEALRAANPTVDPYSIGIGAQLIVPYSDLGSDHTQASTSAVLPTPLPVVLSPVNCFASGDGGAWCFLLAQNNSGMPVESIIASVRLADKDNPIRTLDAALLLDRLPAGSSMPLGVFFPGSLVEPFQAGADLVSALPASPEDSRYLPIHIDSLQVQFSADGLSAQINGQMALEQNEGQAAHVWVLGVVYRQDGQVIGLRRWESPAPVLAGQPAPFSFQVYSAAGTISRAEAFIEARP